MRGSLKERSPGHWAIVLDVRDQATGKRKRKWHSFVGTKREAQVERSRLVAELSRGDHVEATTLKLAQFLDQWITHIKTQVSPRTAERYEEIATKNVVPLLGAVALAKLRPEQISKAYATALETGRRDGSCGRRRSRRRPLRRSTRTMLRP